MTYTKVSASVYDATEHLKSIAYVSASCDAATPFTLGANGRYLVADSSASCGVRWVVPNDKTKCPYCGSTSPDDMRGNCMACGGPR